MSDPIPLSLLRLEIAPPTVGEWATHLRDRGIEVSYDDIGRPSITRARRDPR